MKFALLVLFVAILFVAESHQSNYGVRVKRINNMEPVISKQIPFLKHGSSIFDYNYNVAFAPVGEGKNHLGGLFVRCQNYTSPSNIYQVGPSVISFVPLRSSLDNLSSIEFEPVTEKSVVIQPNGPLNAFGCEDPRAVYNEKDNTYYILYSAVENTTGGIPISRLALATTSPAGLADPSSYQFHGPLFPQVKWSKSGSLLIRPSGPSYLFWGDSTLIPGIQVATTNDLLHYQYNDSIWLPTRKDSFDSLLVEAGPMPLPLSDGNYLFLYNSGRHGYPSPKPDWDVQYNVGYCILDGKDPSKILYRTDKPIFSPELGWEIGTAPNLGLTPNVVFVEGWTALKGVKDTFLIFYGAADSVVGAAILTITIS